MRQLLLYAFLLISSTAFAQNAIEKIINDEYEAGHFNGSILVIKDRKVISKINKGHSNLQFAVPITNKTRIPIASMTKTFTAILTLQMYEKSLLKLDDKITQYVPGLPHDGQDITILDLLTHYSGMKNEPIQAYASRYSTAEYIKRYAVKKDLDKAVSFNYNNVDYIILTRILEEVSQRPFAVLLKENILNPLNMDDTGVISESKIISNLAYGYHNYTFGSGNKQDTLYNDPLVYLSNYAGAGAVYSTTDDLYKLALSFKTNKLLTAKTTSTFLTKPQKNEYIDYARGYPTISFYYNNKTFSKPVLERRGSINGFNSLLLLDEKFNNAVIILANTDTGDLEQIGDKIYREVELLRPTTPLAH